jgi:hypothetical protein
MRLRLWPGLVALVVIGALLAGWSFGWKGALLAAAAIYSVIIGLYSASLASVAGHGGVAQTTLNDMKYLGRGIAQVRRAGVPGERLSEAEMRAAAATITFLSLVPTIITIAVLAIWGGD